MMDVRCVDLFPELVMGDDSNVLRIYVDNVGRIRVHGENFTATYVTFRRNGPWGTMLQLPEVEIIRPITSVCGMGMRFRDLVGGEARH